MAFCCMLSLIILLQICYTETYDDWEVYKYNKFAKYVMYQSKKLNKYYKDKFPDDALVALGLHVSVYPPKPWPGNKLPKGAAGKDVHSSWNMDDDENRVNDFHWGWVNKKWWPTNKKEDCINAGGKREDMAILKHVWDEFAEHGYKPADGARISNMFKPANLKQDGIDKANTLLQFPKRPPPADAVAKASIDYYDDYDEYSASQISTHMKPKRQRHIHHDNEDTDSSSISIPTVFVTLISCMFIFVVCTVYTGCIGLIAGAIGYKIKQSEQTSKVQSFEEI